MLEGFLSELTIRLYCFSLSICSRRIESYSDLEKSIDTDFKQQTPAYRPFRGMGEQRVVAPKARIAKAGGYSGKRFGG